MHDFDKLNLAVDRHEGTRWDRLDRHERVCALAGELGVAAIRKVAVKLYQRLRYEDNLLCAIDHIERYGGPAPGPDGATIDEIRTDPFGYARALRDDIDRGTYEHGPATRVLIPKRSGRGLRPLHLLCMTDRIVHRAAVQVVSPLLDAQFGEFSFGCRRGLDRRCALAVVEQMLLCGQRCCVSADIRDAFEHVPQQRVLQLAAKYLPAVEADEVKRGPHNAPIIESLHGLLRKLVITDAAMGVRQGAATSPLFLNLYLNHLLDRQWQKRFPRTPLIRYVDDLAVFCTALDEASERLTDLHRFLQPLGMRLKNPPDGSSLIVDLAGGEALRWLGYVIEWRGSMVVSPDWDRLPDKINEWAFIGSTSKTMMASICGWVDQLGPALGEGDTESFCQALVTRLRQAGISFDPDRARLEEARVRAWQGWLAVRKEVAAWFSCRMQPRRATISRQVPPAEHSG